MRGNLSLKPISVPKALVTSAVDRHKGWGQKKY